MRAPPAGWAVAGAQSLWPLVVMLAAFQVALSLRGL
jgi:hypothetical protein